MACIWETAQHLHLLDEQIRVRHSRKMPLERFGGERSLWTSSPSRSKFLPVYYIFALSLHSQVWKCRYEKQQEQSKFCGTNAIIQFSCSSRPHNSFGKSIWLNWPDFILFAEIFANIRILSHISFISLIPFRPIHNFQKFILQKGKFDCRI
jgi:hypothetical protein